MPDILELQGVQTRIEQYHILHGVDFTVPQGGITALLGRNGAGKTTTLRSIMGLWRPFAGKITLQERVISGLRTPQIAQAGIGYVPEGMGIFTNLTVAENLTLAARSGPMNEARLEMILTLFPALRRFWHQPAGVLSGGQKQMVAVARAIIEPRALLLIDEPTKGLAPAIVDAMAEAFATLARETTILLVEQNFDFVASIATGAVVMEDGRIIHQSPMRDLVENPELQGRLLGMTGLEAH